MRQAEGVPAGTEQEVGLLNKTVRGMPLVWNGVLEVSNSIQWVSKLNSLRSSPGTSRKLVRGIWFVSLANSSLMV